MWTVHINSINSLHGTCSHFLPARYRILNVRKLDLSYSWYHSRFTLSPFCPLCPFPSLPLTFHDIAPIRLPRFRTCPSPNHLSFSTPPGEYRNAFGRHGPYDRILSTQVCQSEREAPRAPVIKENYGQQIITGGDCMNRADWKRARGNSRSATPCCRVAKFYHHWPPGGEPQHPEHFPTLYRRSKDTGHCSRYSRWRTYGDYAVFAFPAVTSLVHPC